MRAKKKYFSINYYNKTKNKVYTTPDNGFV